LHGVSRWRAEKIAMLFIAAYARSTGAAP
jgi:methyl coenzyme M reductase alpha subunit